MHTHLVETLLEVHDAKVQQKISAFYHHCRPSGLVHVLLFTQIPRSEMVKAPLQIGSTNIWRGPQMARDNVELPVIFEKCCVAIEKYDLRSKGIYRISGMARKVVSLEERLDKDMDTVNLDSEERISDINITSVVKMWFRELPDPLLTSNLHQGFVDAEIENDRLSTYVYTSASMTCKMRIMLHSSIFLGHLHKIVEYETDNSMSIQNHAIVFGQTLFGQVGLGNGSSVAGHGNGVMADAPFQSEVIIWPFLS